MSSVDPGSPDSSATSPSPRSPAAPSAAWPVWVPRPPWAGSAPPRTVAGAPGAAAVTTDPRGAPVPRRPRPALAAPQHPVHPGRRPGLGRPVLLRGTGHPHPASGPAGPPGRPLHPGVRGLGDLLPHPLLPVHGPLPRPYEGGLAEPIADRSVGLEPGHPTLASLLRDAGYATALIGKWHCGYLPDYSPTKSGWDTFFGNLGGALEYYSKLGLAGEYDLYEGDAEYKDLRYYTRILTERAVDYVTRGGAARRPAERDPCGERAGPVTPGQGRTGHGC